MAINKELYERYKAMKAAKQAQGENSSVPKTGFAALSSKAEHISNTENQSINAQTTPQNEQKTWNTTYSQTTPAPLQENINNLPQTGYSQSTIDAYNSQFAPIQSIMTPAPTIAPASFDLNENKISETPKIKKFALIGYPLGHSLSEYIHNAGFKSIGIDATYEIMPTPPDELSERIKYLRSNGYSGFNVTIPLKLPVTLFLDEIDSSADIVKAINTVTIDPVTNVLKGYNTDVTGFIRAIPNDFPLYNKVAAILGTGGAARAAITALAQKQVKEFRIYTRNIANCIEMIDYFRKIFPNLIFNSYQIDRFKDFSDVNILVNATPIGMSGQGVGYTPVEENELRTLPGDALIYDVIYNPKKTNLLKLAEKLNYRTVNGVDMFIYQALEAEKIWMGQIPDFKDMKIAALENL